MFAAAMPDFHVARVCRSLLLAVALCVPGIRLPAQVAQLAPAHHFRHLTTDDGLVSDRIYRICQDGRGYVWMATEAGVSRFDGTHFRNYTASEIGYKDILSIFCDASDRIWIGGFNKTVSYYDRQQDKFVRLGRAEQWFATAPRMPTFQPEFVQLPGGATGVLFNRRDQALRVQPDGAVSILPVPTAIGCAQIDQWPDGRSLDSLDLAQWLHCKGVVLPIPRLHPYASGFLLRHHLVVKDVSGCFLVAKNGAHPPRRLSDDGNLTAVYPDGPDSFYRIRLGRGVERVFCDALGPIRTETYLPDKFINFAFTDREGNRWCSTSSEGVYLLNAQVFWLPPLPGFALDKVQTIVGDHQGGVVLGLEGGDLVTYRDGQLRQRRLGGEPGSRFRQLAFDAQGQLWALTDYLFLKNQQKITGLNCLKAFDLSAGPDWLAATCAATYLGGAAPTRVVFPHRSTAVCFDPLRPDRCWVGTPTDCWRVEFDGQLATQVFAEGVTCMRRGTRGDVWIGTEDARLLRVRGDSLVALQFSVDQLQVMPAIALHRTPVSIPALSGAPGDNINDLLVDEQGRVWVCTNNGLYQLWQEGSRWHSRYFAGVHGLASNEVRAVWVQSGQVVVATGKGVSIFQENTVRAESAPALLITRLNQWFEPDTAEVHQLPFRSKIDLAFTGISFAGNDLKRGIRYVTQIDQNRPDTVLATRKLYENLAPGTHWFTVRAISESGVASAPVRLQFHILSPFWMKPWFVASCVGVILGCGFWLLKRRQQQLQQANLLARRMAELELLAVRSQMNPHFIFNCLNSIQYFIVTGANEAAQLYLRDFSSLIRMTLNLSKQNYITLEQEITYLQTYLTLEQLRFADKMSFEVLVDSGLTPSDVDIPPLLVQPYVENAVKHGVAPLKDRKGRVLITFAPWQQGFSCTIEDNGQGLGSAVRDADHASLGMSLGAERAALLNGIHPGYLTIRVEHPVSPEGATGTRIVLEFGSQQSG